MKDQFKCGDLVWFRYSLCGTLEVLATITNKRPTIFDTKTLEPLYTYDIICARGKRWVACGNSIERATNIK